MKKSIFKTKLKEVLRPMVLQEITAEPLSPTQRNKKPTELVDKLEKLAGSDAEVEFQPVSGKVVIECDKSGKKYRIEISENGCDCYTVVAILDGSERLSLKTAKFEQIEKLIKETIKGRKEGDSYTGKAYKKNAIPEKKEKVEEKSDKDADKSEETEKLKFKKQIDHKPLESKERDIEEVTKGTTGMTDSTKFKKLVDIEGTDKVKLKADKKNASDEKIVQKMDGTSKMKALKESIKSVIKEVLKESIKKKIKLNEGDASGTITLTDEQRTEVIKKLNLNTDETDDALVVDYFASVTTEDNSFDHEFGTEARYDDVIESLEIIIDGKKYKVIERGDDVVGALTSLTPEQIKEISKESEDSRERGYPKTRSRSVTRRFKEDASPVNSEFKYWQQWVKETLQDRVEIKQNNGKIYIEYYKYNFATVTIMIDPTQNSILLEKYYDNEQRDDEYRFTKKYTLTQKEIVKKDFITQVKSIKNDEFSDQG